MANMNRLRKKILTRNNSKLKNVSRVDAAVNSLINFRAKADSSISKKTKYKNAKNRMRQFYHIKETRQLKGRSLV